MTDLQTTHTEWWLLRGGFFAQAGRMYSGPYSTKEDAFTARKTLENLSGHNDLFVDQRLVVNNALIDTTAIVREAKAEALREAADEWAADPDAWGDNEKDYRNELRERANRINAG